MYILVAWEFCLTFCLYSSPLPQLFPHPLLILPIQPFLLVVFIKPTKINMSCPIFLNVWFSTEAWASLAGLGFYQNWAFLSQQLTTMAGWKGLGICHDQAMFQKITFVLWRIYTFQCLPSVSDLSAFSLSKHVWVTSGKYIYPQAGYSQHHNSVLLLWIAYVKVPKSHRIANKKSSIWCGTPALELSVMYAVGKPPCPQFPWSQDVVLTG